MDDRLFAYLQTYLTPRRKQLIEEISAQRTRHFTVVTEDVYQMHNTSAVLRSCDVFGIQDLHVIHDQIGKRIDKEIAMGAQKWVDVHRYDNTQDCLDNLRNKGYRIIATTPDENSISLDDFTLDQKVAIFFGKEKEGLSETVLKNADDFLTIPMYGFTESLNVSVSAAIILRHLRARMQLSNQAWRLTPEELNDLRFQWIKKCIKNVDEIIEHYYENQPQSYEN